jgi:hypothetical protein
MMAMQQAQQQLVSNTANLDLSETAQASKTARAIKNSDKSKNGKSIPIVSK